MKKPPNPSGGLRRKTKQSINEKPLNPDGKLRKKTERLLSRKNVDEKPSNPEGDEEKNQLSYERNFIAQANTIRLLGRSRAMRGSLKIFKIWPKPRVREREIFNSSENCC